jgi:glutamate-1-semialdehyde 2,1-aminomutase
LAVWKSVETNPKPDCRPDIDFHGGGIFDRFELKTLFLQEMIKMGVFMERICISYSHQNQDLPITNEALNHAFEKLAFAIRSGNIKQHIVGEVIKPVFTY